MKFSCENLLCRWYTLVMDLETVMKKAITKSDLNYNRIAIAAGVAKSALTLFMSGKRTLTLPVADRICRVLGLELRQKKAR